MTVFDSTKYDVVGIANQMGLSNNAMVLAIGMVDRVSGEFISVPQSERNKVFPTRGCVFAFDFFKYHPNWKDECICLCAKPNNNANIVDGEDFVWDWKDEPYTFGYKLPKVTKLSEDGQENFNILDAKGILDVEENAYFISGDRIYRYDLGQRLIPYWNLSNISSLLFSNNGNLYLLDEITKTEEGKVDITTDDQLIDWYKKKVLRKEWGKLYESKDFSAVDSIITSELKSLKIPTNVFENRLCRIQSMISNLSLTFEELEDLSTTPWFKDVINESIDSFAERYLEKAKKEISDQINTLKNDHDIAVRDAKARLKNTLDELNLEIEIKKEELAGISANIEEEAKDRKEEIKQLEKEQSEIAKSIELKKKEVERLDTRKDAIIEDFSIIKEVLGSNNSSFFSKHSPSCQIETIDDNCEKELPVAVPFRKNVESYLTKYLGRKIDTDEIITCLSAYKVLLLPDDATVFAIMHATRRCKYVVEYVGVAWKAFCDLWENGLRTIVYSAVENPDMIHFLVLRDINMSFIPSYLHPILDIQSGLTNYFPGTDKQFPENLRILCTKAADIIIPVTSGAIEQIGCVSPGIDSSYSERKKKAWELKESSFVDGYLPASIFEDLPVVEKYMEENHFEAYIDEK